MNENELEFQCLEWFRDIGWDTLYGPDIAPDGADPKRSDYSHVILAGELKTAYSKINPHLPESCFEQVITAVTKPESLDLITNNRAFHRMLINGVQVEYKKDDDIIKDYAFLVDFEKVSRNSFYAVNQFTITGTKQPRRPDIVCFINGLPLAVIELKSPEDENANIWDAFNQLQTYKAEIPDLFTSNEALIVSDGYIRGLDH